MADLNKVSKTVQNFVSEVKKLEGSKKKIDSINERMMLSNYLSGNAFYMNTDERKYIEGHIAEFDENSEKQFVKEAVTDNTKKEVDKILKRMGNKKKLDSDEEAQALVLILKDSHNDINQADREYITQLIISNGYEHYLLPNEVPPVNVTIVVQNPVTEEKNENKIHGEETPTIQKETKTKTDFPRKKTMRKYRPIPSKKKPPKSVEPPITDPAKKTEPAPPKEYKVSEKARAQGFGIANKIEEELHDTITNSSTIKNEFAKINRQNAYSFVGKMIEITDSHSVITDARKYVTYREFKRIAACLLNQALDIGLSKTNAYKNLKAEYDIISRQQTKNPNKTPDVYDAEKLNAALINLYNEMSKVYK